MSETKNKRTRPNGNGAATKDGDAKIELLPWWYDLISSTITSPLVNLRRAIFTNRTLRFSKVKAVGFDFDHTLAVYNCAALDKLAMELVIERLVAEDQIPRAFFDDIPSPDFARKGLLVDVELGNVVKVDRHGHVTRAYHGRHRLSSDEKRKQYGDADYIPHVTHGDRFIQVDSAFAKPEVLIFSALAPRMGCVKCNNLWKRIRYHTDLIHRDGSLKKVIMERPLDFLSPDLETISMLRRLKRSGKQVFLLTNSEWEYTSHMVRPAFGLGTGKSEDWLDLFDVVVVEARKPNYFKPRNGTNGHGESHDGPAAPSGAAAPHAKVMRGGNILDLEARLGCSGPEVLYVGDHIYADLITSKRQKAWRTMLVISELEEEMEAQALLPGVALQLKQADERRTETERDVWHWQAIESAIENLEDEEHTDMVVRIKETCARHKMQAVRALSQHIRERERLRTRIADVTNPHWGSLFRASSELTYYGRQVEDFACTYTSRATNIGLYPPEHYFRSAMDYLPHELESM